MAETGLTGTMNIVLNDGVNEYTVASLRNCTVSHSLQMLERLNTDVYGWKTFVPGNKDWNASATHVELSDAGTPAAYLRVLQDYAFNKTLLTVQFTHDDVNYYTATAYIETWQIGGAENDVFTGQFTLKGVSTLAHLDIEASTPRIYMYLDGANIASLGGKGLYQQDINLGNLQLIKADTDQWQQLFCIHKTRTLLYWKPLVSSINIYAYDLATGIESVWATVSARTGTAPFRFQLDTVNDQILCTVDKSALGKSVIYFFDFDGNVLSTWTPTALGDSGVNFDILGIDHAANEVYLEVSAFWSYQAFHFDTKAYKHAVHRYTAAYVGWFGSYVEAQNKFICGSNQDSSVSTIPNGINGTDLDAAIEFLNYTNINQIYWSTYDSRVYVGSDDDGDSTRFDIAGNNDEDLLDGNTGILSNAVCVYDPNLRQ